MLIIQNIEHECQLNAILSEKGLKAADLVRMTGINKANISQYILNKKAMSLTTAYIVSDALNCKIDDLYIFRKQL